jgi:hypothetical protein
MELHLIKGSFEKEEALELIQQLIQLKIKFHEKKIQQCEQEEDIKMRENRIKLLQNEFNQARALIQEKSAFCSIQSTIYIE